LIDNSIFWTKHRFEKNKKIPPAILVTTDLDSFSKPAIIVADNGEGFKMEFEKMTRPFNTLKPGGMGLGLYFTSMVMELINGELAFLKPGDIKIPSSYNGAIIALIFKK